VSATASSTGAATFTFPAVPIGSTWTGTVTVQGAPANAIFLANIGATPWADWAGNSVGGPIQGLPNQQLVVNATGLAPGQSYLCVWTGSSDPQGLAAPVWPEPTNSAQTVQLGQGSPILGPAAFTASGGLISLAVSPPSTTRTLLILMANIGGGDPPVTGLSVTGQQTTNAYYSQGVYLATGQPVGGNRVYFAVVPIAPAIDSSYSIAIATAGGGYTVTVIGDTAFYDESVFYNGVIRSTGASLAAAGSTNMLGGPARLLTLSLSATTAANIGISGSSALGLVAAGSVAVSFPPNTILQVNNTLILTQSGAGASLGLVTYAYP
jgi:hypothetical protein